MFNSQSSFPYHPHPHPQQLHEMGRSRGGVNNNSTGYASMSRVGVDESGFSPGFGKSIYRPPRRIKFSPGQLDSALCLVSETMFVDDHMEQIPDSEDEDEEDKDQDQDRWDVQGLVDKHSGVTSSTGSYSGTVMEVARQDEHLTKEETTEKKRTEGVKLRNNWEHERMECYFCQKSFPTCDHLNDHLAMHTGEKRKLGTKRPNPELEDCIEIFEMKIGRGQEDNPVDPNIPKRSRSKRHTCTTCRKKSLNAKFSCYFCQRCVSTKCSLNNHLAIHTREKDPRLRSSKTSKATENVTKKLTNPQTQQILGGIEVNPEVIINTSKDANPKRQRNQRQSRLASRKKSLQQKAQLPPPIPMKRKFFWCYFCQECYPTLENLNTHLAFHTGEKNLTEKKVKMTKTKGKTGSQPKLYQCPGCDDKFGSESDLGIHFNQVHLNRYVCKCGANFAQKRSLERHAKVAKHESGSINNLRKGDSKNGVNMDAFLKSFHNLLKLK